jgi:hypothetical protein
MVPMHSHFRWIIAAADTAKDEPLSIEGLIP